MKHIYKVQLNPDLPKQGLQVFAMTRSFERFTTKYHRATFQQSTASHYLIKFKEAKQSTKLPKDVDILNKDGFATKLPTIILSQSLEERNKIMLRQPNKRRKVMSNFRSPLNVASFQENAQKGFHGLPKPVLHMILFNLSVPELFRFRRVNQRLNVFPKLSSIPISFFSLRRINFGPKLYKQVTLKLSELTQTKTIFLNAIHFGKNKLELHHIRHKSITTLRLDGISNCFNIPILLNHITSIETLQLYHFGKISNKYSFLNIHHLLFHNVTNLFLMNCFFYNGDFRKSTFNASLEFPRGLISIANFCRHQNADLVKKALHSFYRKLEYIGFIDDIKISLFSYHFKSLRQFVLISPIKNFQKIRHILIHSNKLQKLHVQDIGVIIQNNHHELNSLMKDIFNHSTLNFLRIQEGRIKDILHIINAIEYGLFCIKKPLVGRTMVLRIIFFSLYNNNNNNNVRIPRPRSMTVDGNEINLFIQRIHNQLCRVYGDNNYKLLMEFRGNVGNVINDFKKDRHIEKKMGKEYHVSVIIDGERKIVFEIKSKKCIIQRSRWRFNI